MARSKVAFALAALVLTWGVVAATRGADESSQRWLKGAGDELQICLSGEVVEADGSPAEGVVVSGGINSLYGLPSFDAKVTGNRFEAWLPVNRVKPYSLWVRAASADGQRVAYERFGAFQLRQMAIDGLHMTLEVPSRRVAVKVTHDGVPVNNAHVQAELSYNIDLQARTGADGVAWIGLLPEQELQGLMAWTDDPRVGGFSFSRQPTRDPAGNEFVVELSDCRDQKLRFVDEAGTPLPGIDFVAQIATPEPDYNYIGVNEHSRQVSDAAGEAVLRWFPDWKRRHFYIDMKTPGWLADRKLKLVDGVYVFELKRSQPRRRVEGRLEIENAGAGGVWVKVESFQGELDNHSDGLMAFTNADGSFAVDVLPGSTYCAWVGDARWVSEIIDLIPYDWETDVTTPIALKAAEGEKVTLVTTTGDERKPYPHLGISLRREHQYSWRENGEIRRGTMGPQWWVTTDAQGRAVTHAPPGDLIAMVYTPLWRTEEAHVVKAGQDLTIKLHQAVVGKHKATGRVVLGEGVEGSLDGVTIKVGAVDGNFEDTLTAECEADGSFAFETPASVVGVYAYTSDARAAGHAVARDVTQPIEVVLAPTLDYEGQLLGPGDRPLAGHGVRAIVRVEGDEDYDGRFIKSFDAMRVEGTTDSLGNFTLRGVPARMKAHVQADALGDGTSSGLYEEVFLEPNDNRPRGVLRLAATPASASSLPLAERYAKAQRDGALGGFRVMAILTGGGPKTAEFVGRHLVEYETNREASGYMQVVVSGPAESLTPADAEFFAQQMWSWPDAGHVTALALDTDGRELGRLELDAADAAAAERAAEFIVAHAPPRVDAEQKWREAFDEAKRTNRRVWARVGQRYCGPCFRLARWLDDHRDMLAKDYVMLKIDSLRDEHGAEVAERLTRGGHHGIPFHAIFNADETVIVDSAGPLGNIGHPSGYEGQKQLRKMLMDSRRELTEAEVEELVMSVGE